MSDEPARPRPQYGEYATPEEVAEARGPLPVEPRHEVAPVRPARSALGSAPPPRGAPTAARNPRQANNLITVLLLVVGIWNTVTSIPSLLDFGATISKSLELFGYGSVTIGAIGHTAGVVLLVFSILVLIAAVGVSLRLIRRGKRSIWVPLVAAVGYFIGTVIIMSVVVANTPALANMLQSS